ncbi:MAG TPA: hypothetical protein EYN00_01095 [Planctomycetes bacterium]|nr:hypothetical protein [Planctomycetota bacterium]
MIMHRIRLIVFLTLFAAASVMVGGELQGADSKIVSSKTKPMTALKKVTRNLAKSRAYGASCTVEGGLSRKPDHQLFQTTVREEYRGDIYGNVMHLPSMKVFRTSSTGAISDGVQWYRLQSLPEGKKLDRLFAFPAHLLVKAAKNPAKVEWISSEDDEIVELPPERGKGGTSVARKREDRIPHVLRIQVPDKEAIQYFVEVQNSGCLSGG